MNNTRDHYEQLMNSTRDHYDQLGNSTKGRTIEAATPWQKYTGDIIDPVIGEWCLWSVIINEKRNYFSGNLFLSDNSIMLNGQGYKSVHVDDTLYWARVNKMVFENETNHTR